MEDVVLLDTSVLFDFLANREAADTVEGFLRDGKGAVSAITVYELYRGVTADSHIEKRTKLLSFLHTIDVSAQIAEIAGRLYTNLKSAGKLIDNEDILIAATSLHHAIPVFTMNRKHFSRVPNLRLLVM